MRRCIPILLAAACLLAWAAPAYAGEPIRVYYAGPEEGGGAVPQALDIAGFEVVSDPALADVLILNDSIPDPQSIGTRVQEGAGLVLILGPHLTPEAVGRALGIDVRLEPGDGPLSLVPAPGASEPALGQIAWTSAPQVRDRLVVSTSASDLIPLVTGFEDGSLLLGSRQVGRGRAYVLTPFLDGSNPQIQSWSYFNYLIYHLAMRAAGRDPVAFADYAGSPVPHPGERAWILALLAGALLVAVAAFLLVRRYSLAHPEALDGLVADRQEYAAREAATDWEQVGFHRPLGGFLFAMMLGLVLFIPVIIYQNLILPVYILPSAQALGLWGRVTQFFSLLWFLFDMGTSTAFIKYFAELRVDDPRRGIQYGQLFVWWQALSGAVQVALVTLLASTLVPRSTYALYAWSIIIHTTIQLPGFYQVMRHALTGLQRFDYAQILDMGLALIFPMLTQPAIVLLMVAWGQAHPVFGVPMGGLLGMGLAAYASEFLSFILGLWLYRRLGYNARLLFMAHFDWAVVKSAFRFGVFDMLASAAWTVGQAAEILITQARLVNYAEVWGNWVMAQNFVAAYQVTSTLYNNLMSSISESISHTRTVLSQYYAALAYKWGGMVSAFIGAVLLAVADRFILGASGPEFVRAAGYAVPLIVWGAIQYPSWVGDNVQLGANKPYLKAILVAGEQALRIVLALLLLERYQITGLIIAYFVALLTKDLVGYVVNHRLCFPQRFYRWQSLAAPLLAGAAHYLLLRWAGGLIWKGAGDQISSVIVFFVSILPSFPLYAFFYGLAGGWDDEGLAEFRRAVDLSSFMRPLAWLFWASSALGARVSPLHNRFPLDIVAAARAEAQALTEERVSL
jgi:O-antigen/teichoic acid export membrane protein